MIRHQNAVAMFLTSAVMRDIHSRDRPPFGIFSGGRMPLMSVLVRTMATITPVSGKTKKSIFCKVRFLWRCPAFAQSGFVMEYPNIIF